MDLSDFAPDDPAIDRALRHLNDAAVAERRVTDPLTAPLPKRLPDDGVGPDVALDLLARPVLDAARDLGAPGFFAHMDPPTPWITWVTSMWTASRNQNLLHPDTAPTARGLEATVIDWLAPSFGMDGGHLVPGSTIANLSAIWAAREAGATEVVSSGNAHLSVAKAAHLLGLRHRAVANWSLCGDVSDAVAVITAGVTSTGEIETLDAAADARWRHVDAAWAGPLRLSDRHHHLLDGVEGADSVAVSAHKWLFQPKESAMVLFCDSAAAHESISFGGTYLAVPNVGVLGSHGASAVPLLATLLAYGRSGVAGLIDRSMEIADELHRLIEAHPELESRTGPQSGVVNWRHRSVSAEATRAALADDVFVSSTVIDGEPWLRSVAANPWASPERVVDGVLAAARRAR